MADAAVRPATLDDAAAVQAIYAPYVAGTVISFEIEPPSVEEMAHRIGRVSRRFPWLVWVEDGQVLGYAYASPHAERAAYAWSVDVAVYVRESAHRRGIGRGLYERLLPVLRRQGFHNAFAGIALPNAGSVGLHEACGFALVGVYREVGFKLGAWRDVGRWQLRLGDAAEAPSPPRPFTPQMLAP